MLNWACSVYLLYNTLKEIILSHSPKIGSYLANCLTIAIGVCETRLQSKLPWVVHRHEDYINSFQESMGAVQMNYGIFKYKLDEVQCYYIIPIFFSFISNFLFSLVSKVYTNVTCVFCNYFLRTKVLFSSIQNNLIIGHYVSVIFMRNSLNAYLIS